MRSSDYETRRIQRTVPPLPDVTSPLEKRNAIARSRFSKAGVHAPEIARFGSGRRKRMELPGCVFRRILRAGSARRERNDRRCCREADPDFRDTRRIEFLTRGRNPEVAAVDSYRHAFGVDIERTIPAVFFTARYVHFLGAGPRPGSRKSSCNRAAAIPAAESPREKCRRASTGKLKRRNPNSSDVRPAPAAYALRIFPIPTIY